MVVNPFTYSFMSIVFHPAAADRQPMVSAPPLLSSERHIPYSNLTVVDLGGESARHFATPIKLAPEQVVTFEALRGASGPLEVAGVVWPSATLLKLDNHTMSPRGEWHFYDAEWVVGTPV